MASIQVQNVSETILSLASDGVVVGKEGVHNEPPEICFSHLMFREHNIEYLLPVFIETDSLAICCQDVKVKCLNYCKCFCG